MKIQKLTVAAMMITLLMFAPRTQAAQPPHKIALGAYIFETNLVYINSISTAKSVISGFTNLTMGNLPKVVMIGGFWSSGNSSGDTNNMSTGLNSGGMDGIRAMGATPLYTWQSMDKYNNQTNMWPLAKIAAGTYDSYITNVALNFKNWGHPCFLRFNHEMTGDWFPYSTDPKSPYGNTGTNYVKAWRRAHDIFKSVGATNVLWVWCPGWKPDSLYAAAFPGDAYVDWVALDEYNWGTNFYPHQNGLWQTFPQVALADYNAVTALSARPMMLTEFSCEEGGGDKGAWIKQTMMTDIPTLFPRIKLIIWFEQNLHPKEGDWRCNTSINALTNFQAATTSPLYSGTLLPDLSDIATTAGDPINSEMETATVYDKSSDTLSIISDPNFSNGQGAILAATNTNGYIIYKVPAVPAGAYDVIVGMKKINTRGMFQLAVSPAEVLSWSNVGPVVDEYVPYDPLKPGFTNVDLGIWMATTSGDKLFRFTVTGKNAASSGYGICLDYITLVPQSVPPTINLGFHRGVVVRGEAGQNYNVEYTADPSQISGWTPAITLKLTNAVQEWIDPQPADGTKRFYRATLTN